MTKPPHPAAKARSAAARTRRPPAPRAAAPEPHHLYGLHAVAAAFANPGRRRHRLVATRNALHRLESLGAAPDVRVELVESRRLSGVLGGDAVHQGCLLYCDPLPERPLEDIRAARRLVALDQVTDPHNVGAVLRSCAAFGVDGVIVTTRHSPRETPVLAKAAAGALELIPLLRVVNLADALLALTEAGVTTVGLDAAAEHALEEIGLGEPFCLVLGAEGRGLRQRTGETCRHLARIDMPGRMPSLNVSNAAALALYIADRTVGAKV